MKVDYTISDKDVAQSGNIKFMWIIAVVLKIYVNFSLHLNFLMPTPYITYTRTSRFFVITFNCFVYDSYLPIRLWQVVKCGTSGDVASEVAKCE